MSPVVMMKRVSIVAVATWLAAAVAAAQMPDVSQMSGVPLPTGDVPDGTVSVRVVRGDLANNVASHPVELHAHAGNQVWRARTDETGRAMFPGIPPGVSVHASTSVDGQRLESQDFPMPAAGGVRVLLVAMVGSPPAPGASGSPAMPPPPHGVAPAAPAGPAQPGTVSIGGQSRFVVELAESALDVYYLLDIANTATHAVTTDPLVFDTPDGARGLTILEGSSSQARAEGSRLVVSGPFPPGITAVQFAYQVPYRGSVVRIGQRLPVASSQTSVVVRKFGDMHFTSPQAGDHREITSEDRRYIMASGPGLAAGSAIELEITGLPHHANWPRVVALTLAALVAAAGVWLALGDGRTEAAGRIQRLEARREQLLGELVALETHGRSGGVDRVRHESRRLALFEQLERVYADLEQAGADLDAVAPAVTAAAPVRASA